MATSTKDKVLQRVRSMAGRGIRVVCHSDLAGLGSRAAIDQALCRLRRDGRIRRLTQGVYDYPQQHPRLGFLPPDLDHVAKTIARRSGHTLQISGARAANALGLSTQVPARAVYLTNGPSRKVKVGNQTLEFRHSSRLAAPGTKAGDVVQAISFVGPDSITSAVAALIRSQISDSDIRRLKKSRMPARMRPAVERVIQSRPAPAAA